MPTITRLQVQKHNKERVNVFLDDEYAFAVTLDMAVVLRKGQELDAADVARLRDADTLAQAYARAVRYLGSRPRSQVEIERYLRGKEYDDGVIAATVARLLEQGYLDDASFAQYWRENRDRFRPRSAAALRSELRQKGVDRQTTDIALAGLDEEATAWAAVESKLSRWQELPVDAFNQKVTGFLARRGFGYATIRAVCRRARNEIDEASETDHGQD
jgi:regulatory protein